MYLLIGTDIIIGKYKEKGLPRDYNILKTFLGDTDHPDKPTLI